MKQVEVQIMGQGYLLGCPEGGEARLQAAVDRVDAAMCKIRDAGKIKARDRIAVLAALNLAFDLTERPPIVLKARPTPRPNCSPCWSVSTPLWAKTASCSDTPASPASSHARDDGGGPLPLQCNRLQNRRTLYFLEPMLL